jgi:tetratricopeptide (TPR) repeat protein
MQVRRSFALVVALAIVAIARPVVAASAADTIDTILVFPFENTSRRAEYNWVGESFPEMLSELLDRSDLSSIRPDERDLAYEREGLPTSTVLTRATTIKVGERAGADLIVLGTYRVDGEKEKETITVSARLVDIREGRIIGNEFNRGGLLMNLQELQGEIAYAIIQQRNPSANVTRGEIVGEATRVPPEAFADYMKAVTTADRQNKMLFLARAIDTYQKDKSAQGQYNQAIFELGRLSYLEGKWDDAVKLLSRIDAKYPRYGEAAFYLGVSYANAKKNAEALKVFTDLVPKMPLYEVYNNAGVVYLRANRVDDALIYLKPAAEAATRDMDVQFNYGYALWLKNDYAGAMRQLQTIVERRPAEGEAIRFGPQDGEVFYILAKAAERAGAQQEAATALDQAKRYLPSFAQWETKRQIPDLLRLKPRFSKAGLIRLLKDQRQSGDATPRASGDASANAQSMASARELFAADRDREALDLLARVLQTSPDNAEAHLIRGRIYERSGDYDRAIEALKAATFWDPKSLVAHVTLGRIYAFRNDCANAQASMRKALQIDPTNADALALKRAVESKCGG